MKEVRTTQRQTATYYLVLKDGNDKEVKVRVDLKKMDAEIPLYKSSALDLKKLVALKEEHIVKPKQKLAAFDAKALEQIRLEKEVSKLNARLKELMAADSLTRDTLAIDSIQKRMDTKGKEAGKKKKEAKALFAEYKAMMDSLLGKLRDQYTQRLANAFESAYQKMEAGETEFKSVDDDALFWDIRLDLLKIDATRAMEVPRRINEKKEETTEKVTAGKTYYILHFAEFGARYERDEVKRIFSGLKLWEFHFNPYLMDKQFGMVCDDQDRTQHYINSVVDYKNYNGVLIEDNKIEIALEEMLAIAKAHIPYKQENNNPPDYMRTAETDEALAKMDCSEFVSRYLKALGLFDEVPYFHTGQMASDDFQDEFHEKLVFVEGSASPTFKEIQAGDIFLWRDNKRDPPAGHTGVVKSFDSVTGNVEILEALVWSGGKNDDICKNCTRLSTYKYNSNTLNGHEGWIGYFRPLVD